MTKAEEKVAAAIPVLINGIKGDLDPKTALAWVHHILTSEKSQ